MIAVQLQRSLIPVLLGFTSIVDVSAFVHQTAYHSCASVTFSLFCTPNNERPFLRPQGQDNIGRDNLGHLLVRLSMYHGSPMLHL